MKSISDIVSQGLTPNRRQIQQDLKKTIFTKGQLIQTLQQIRKLKNKTCSKLCENEKIIKQKQESIQELKQYIIREEQKTKQMVYRLQKELNNKDIVIKTKDEEIIRLQIEINRLNFKVQQLQSNRKQLQMRIEYKQGQLNKKQQQMQKMYESIKQYKYKIEEINNNLGLNLMSNMDDDLEYIHNNGGIKQIITKIIQLEYRLNQNTIQNDQKDRQVQKVYQQYKGNINKLNQQLDVHIKKCQNYQILLQQKTSNISQFINKIAQHQNTIHTLNLSIKQQSISITQLSKTCYSLKTKLQYNQLVQMLIQQQSDYYQVNNTLQDLNKYKTQYYSNVQKIQYLCQLLQLS